VTGRIPINLYACFLIGYKEMYHITWNLQGSWSFKSPSADNLLSLDVPCSSWASPLVSLAHAP